MRNLLFLSVLLLGATWAMAQNDQAPTSPSDQSPTAQSDATPTSSGGSMTVQGCLSGSDGNYMLTDKSGTMYQLTGDTAKLGEHVGHEVKITGTASGGTMSPSGSGDAGDTAGASKQTLQVSSVKHVSKSCASGGGMSH